jgi:hypothetical protein
MRRKGKHVGLVPASVTTAPDIDARVALIQALIPVALDKVMEELQADVERLAGARYAREGRLPGHVRWTHQRGSVYLADQKLPIEVPRVRDQHRHVEVPLPTYERLQQPRTGDTGLLHKVLGGLSTREYERCAEAVPEAFGLSASTVSRRFKRASARKLRELMERRLDGYDLVALLLDGKTSRRGRDGHGGRRHDHGGKDPLGFVQTATENRKVCARRFCTSSPSAGCKSRRPTVGGHRWGEGPARSPWEVCVRAPPALPMAQARKRAAVFTRSAPVDVSAQVAGGARAADP